MGREAEAVLLSHSYLKINGSFYFLLSLLFIFRQSLQGLGQSVVTTAAGIMELFMRAFAAIILSRSFGFEGICFSSPLAWLGALFPLTGATILTFKSWGGSPWRKRNHAGTGARVWRIRGRFTDHGL